MNEGFVSLHRRITKWEWYQNDNVFRVFVHLLLMANYQDNKWQGTAVQRGQRITSPNRIAMEIGTLSVQQVRTALNKLKSTNEITIKTTNKYSVITINKYDDYQEINKQLNKRITNKQQTNNKQITTNNKENKENNNTGELASDLIEYWNTTFNRRFKVSKKGGWLKNFEEWLKTYSLDEIKQAVGVAQTQHHFYKDKITPDMLFRVESGDDRIGIMLNYKISGSLTPKDIL